MPEAIRGKTRRSLEVFFKPKSVAVVGASGEEGSIGRAVLWNLISNPFNGTVYPVNPKRRSVLGIRAYASVTAIPEKVELAVIITPAKSVPAVIAECAQVGVTSALIISNGFREIGPQGMELEQQVLAIARKGGVRLMGPSCLGVMCPISGINASAAPAMPRRGSVALISESAAICTALLDWSLREHVGFSAFLSTGSMLDIGWGDLIDYLGNDPYTRSIVIYMESVGDAKAFLSAAREVALDKPILLIKGGRSGLAAMAAASHTGTLAGSDAVLDAAFRRVGVLRVNELDDIFHMTEVLAHQPRPAGPNLAIVTNAGGPGVLAADMAIGLGEQLASLAPATTEALNHVLPRHWSHNNPVDILGDADPARYAAAIKIVADDPNVDGLLVIMSPQAVSDPLQIAQKVAPFAHLGGKPILASWMGGARATEGEAVLNKAGIPTFPFPDSAVRAFHYMWRYSYNLNALYETPTLADNNDGDAAKVTNLIEAARRSGRELLTEHESKVLLEAYSIPTAETRLAHSVEEAVEIAEEIGFPVVLKLHSFTITHKSETGGVQLNLRDEAEVRRAFGNIRTAVWSNAPEEHFEGVTVQPMIRSDGYELIVGSMVDPQFGPVLLFGTGGRLVEVFRDRALALPPLNTTLARRFMEQTRIFDALNGTRGNKPADVKALEALLVRFSRLVLEQPFIKEIDINPLLASPDGLLALDARVVLWPQSTDVASIPKAPIRLYPLKYIDNDVTLKNGTKLVIRPIRPEDEPALARFHSTLSDESVYRRYFTQIKLESRIRHERLTRLCFIDYDRQMGLVAEKPTSDGTPAEIIGIGRLVKSPLESEAEVAAVISDEYQRMGLGRALVSRLLQFARDEKIERLSASVLSGNPAMERLLEGQGFAFAVGSDPDVLEGEMQLFGS